ncbi:hypothetical protein K469DRAFT_165051 [Zopfia rhizophila CBS 207.26]|uniref:Zn(2)-C6 fungal-type domain-containing protein n=1 Tax=Zopfia rhizophila CBS 207.26 TaxID=1314779 RepID=A0A6A6E3R5_9PEZI|nr:hypothetical protein K469DRAFT_165051 [Zopfia rhizophila CBS 207.26]
MNIAKSAKGCWTCKDRKIACDKCMPKCQTCLKSGRECLGYDLRLSWPRKDDQRRSILAKDPDRSESISQGWTRQREFLNVFSSDIELSNSMISDMLPIRASRLPNLLRNPSWAPFPLNRTQIDLFSYYEHNVAKILTSANNSPVQNLVLRMSFTDASLASSAILYAIYALSSLHLSDRAQAEEFKSKAVSAVWASTAQHPGTKDVLQRIVAAILLALFETFANPVAPYEWAADICYAKTAVIATYAPDKSYQGDPAIVLDWVYYYDVLSKFSVRHFDRRYARQLICAKKKQIMLTEMNSPRKTSIIPTIGCSIEVLTAISNIIDTVLEMEICDDPQHIENIEKLERRLKYSQQEVSIDSLSDSGSFNNIEQMRNIAELYRLSGLIYLHRAARGTSVPDQLLQKLVNDAFTVLEKLETCERTFPLFITGCEARDDIRRGTILRILNATQAQFAPGNSLRARQYIERFWMQEDLDVNQEIDYASKVTAVLSTADSLPAFA